MQLTNKYLDLLPINCLINCHFWIPAYQRGYRWEEQQVTDLLDDLWEFSCISKNDGDAFYCLQPIVVMRREEKWELIDGQQRLTTIFILLSILKQELYHLSFETRQKSEGFLNDLDNNDPSSIDSYFITTAYDVVKGWFEKHGTEVDQQAFIDTLLKKTKIIWYQVEQSDRPIDIFTRLNIGKIPLTNAELIKALLIRKIKEKYRNDPNVALLKEQELARAWDRIESTLQDEHFWAFINNAGKDSYETRIDFLLGAVAENLSGEKQASPTDRYATFRAFHKSLENEGKSVQDIWDRVEEYFLTLVDWFSDRELFHLIGFLVTCGEDIWKIRKEAEGETHLDFRQSVIKKVKEKFKTPLTEMTYEEHYQETKRALLLFNILTTLKEKDGSFFPFHLYNPNNFTLEHIHPQFPQQVYERNKQDVWIKEHIDFIRGIDPDKAMRIGQEVDIIIKPLKPDDGIPMEKFQEIFTKMEKAFEDESAPEDPLSESVHTIDNLALLDTGTNSSLSNLHFYKKRQGLLEREKKDDANWILPCTRNVFLKYYSPSVSLPYFWNSTDRRNYLDALQTVLAGYLPA